MRLPPVTYFVQTKDLRVICGEGVCGLTQARMYLVKLKSEGIEATIGFAPEDKLLRTPPRPRVAKAVV